MLLINGSDLARGAAWTLFGFGMLELAAGLFFGARNEGPKLEPLAR